jgi:hypothetical protein
MVSDHFLKLRLESCELKLVMTESTDIMKLQDEALKCSSLIRDAISSLFDADTNPSSTTSETLRRLIHFMSSRMQAVHFMISHDYCWDAEILLRSCMETSLKFLRICLAEGTAADDLAYEFSETLLKVHYRKQKDRAKYAENAFEDSKSMGAKIMRHLGNESVFEPSELPRKEIQRLKQEWSFSGLVKALKDSPKDKMYLNMLGALLHSHSIASHLAHGDIIALDLMMDRSMREPDELLLLTKAHNSRIIVDPVWMFFLCGKALSSYYKQPLIQAEGISNSLAKCSEISGKITQEFYATQESFYSE